MRRIKHLVRLPRTRTAASVLIVGGGPRAAMVLERLVANRAHSTHPLVHVHIVDPYPVGAGRIWRSEQSELLKLNSMAMDVSMFTDESVQCQGPAVPGPSLWEWICQVRAGNHPEYAGKIRAAGDNVAAEFESLAADSFPTRVLHSHYLSWFFEQTIAAKDQGLQLEIHTDTVTNIHDAGPGEAHRVDLASGKHLTVHQVLLVQGHVEALPNSASEYFFSVTAKNPTRLAYVPPAYTTDVDLSRLLAGHDVLVSGMGLAFIDLCVLLMEGRGGSFSHRADGTYEYVASGQEPRLLVGSRRGVPYLSKIRGSLRGETSVVSPALDRAAVEKLINEHGRLDFRTHLWPLVAKDAAYAYYRELFTAYPHRVTLAWEEFEPRFMRCAWYSSARIELEALAIPKPEDRLDFEVLGHPLAAASFTDAQDVHAAVAQVISNDLRLRDSGEHSETLGLFLGLLGCYMRLGTVVRLEELSAKGRTDLSGWWHGFFSYVDSGPPAERLRQLQAIERAGLIQFLGPNVDFGFSESAGVFTAHTVVSREPITANAFVEARLPSPTLSSTTDPLLSSLYERGIITQDSQATGKLRVDSTHRVITASGDTVSWLFAAGAGVAGFGGGAFSRPHSNAAPFRDSDAIAREILSALTQHGPQENKHQAPQRQLSAARAPQLSAIALLASLDSVHRYLG